MKFTRSQHFEDYHEDLYTYVTEYGRLKTRFKCIITFGGFDTEVRITINKRSNNELDRAEQDVFYTPTFSSGISDGFLLKTKKSQRASKPYQILYFNNSLLLRQERTHEIPKTLESFYPLLVVTLK